jgi:molybdenum cofactor synthesis domain-containing protein
MGTPEVSVGVLTVSDRGASGATEDISGPLIGRMVAERTSWLLVRSQIVPDDREQIESILRAWCDEGLSLILTTGGTGFAPRDVTPEATRRVLEREAPGIAEALRAESLKITRHAMLSRGIAGMRGQTLIINLPGSPKAVKEGLEILLPVLPHALALLTDQPGSERGHRSV